MEKRKKRCETEGFAETNICKLCVMLPSRVLRGLYVLGTLRCVLVRDGMALLYLGRR